MVGKKGFFELKKCTVSGLKRQFDKWHLFSASTFPHPSPNNVLLGQGRPSSIKNLLVVDIHIRGLVVFACFACVWLKLCVCHHFHASLVLVQFLVKN